MLKLYVCMEEMSIIETCAHISGVCIREIFLV